MNNNKANNDEGRYLVLNDTRIYNFVPVCSIGDSKIAGEPMNITRAAEEGFITIQEDGTVITEHYILE